MDSSTEEVSMAITSSTYKALNNSLVLRTIMQHLASKDLLNVRLVAKKWDDEATIQLLSTRQEIRVNFLSVDKPFEFYSRYGTLEEFADSCFGDRLRKFPCSHFNFKFAEAAEWETQEMPADLFKFFSNHGHHVKILGLIVRPSRNSTISLSTIRKIIFEWTPNLKSLTLKGWFFQDGGDARPPTPQIDNNTSKKSLDDGLECPKLTLEHLKIHWGVYLPGKPATAQQWSLLITDILSSAPNLKTILDDQLLFAKEIILAGNASLVRRLIWEVYDEDMTTRCSTFLETRPQLVHLEIYLRFCIDVPLKTQSDPPSNFLTNLQLLFQSSRETLKTLKIKGRLDSIPGASSMNIPVMTNVQKFCVADWSSLNGGQGRLLPEGFSVQKLFPRLKSLRIEGVGDPEWSDEVVDNPFMHTCNSSATVQKLRIGTNYTRWDDYFDPSCLGQALISYPNVRELHLNFYGSEEELLGLFRGIWTSWNESSLEELIVGLPDYELVSEKRTNFMDQALTGFDQDTCRILRKLRCCTHCHGEKDLERGPSILDMTKLKRFQLKSNSSYFPSFYSIYTQVSVVHAFDLMRKRQNLRVKVNGVELKETDCNSDFGGSHYQENFDE